MNSAATNSSVCPVFGQSLTFAFSQLDSGAQYTITLTSGAVFIGIGSPSPGVTVLSQTQCTFTPTGSQQTITIPGRFSANTVQYSVAAVVLEPVENITAPVASSNPSGIQITENSSPSIFQSATLPPTCTYVLDHNTWIAYNNCPDCSRPVGSANSECPYLSPNDEGIYPGIEEFLICVQCPGGC